MKFLPLYNWCYSFILALGQWVQRFKEELSFSNTHDTAWVLTHQKSLSDDKSCDSCRPVHYLSEIRVLLISDLVVQFVPPKKWHFFHKSASFERRIFPLVKSITASKGLQANFFFHEKSCDLQLSEHYLRVTFYEK